MLLLDALTHWQFAVSVGAWMALAMVCNWVGMAVVDGLNPPPFDRFD